MPSPDLPQMVASFSFTKARKPSASTRQRRSIAVASSARIFAPAADRRPEGRVLEPRAVVREVGREDEEGLPVVEHRQPQGEGRLGGGVDPPDEDRDEEKRPRTACRNGSSISTACSGPVTPGTTRASPGAFSTSTASRETGISPSGVLYAGASSRA